MARSSTSRLLSVSKSEMDLIKKVMHQELKPLYQLNEKRIAALSEDDIQHLYKRLAVMIMFLSARLGIFENTKKEAVTSENLMPFLVQLLSVNFDKQLHQISSNMKLLDERVKLGRDKASYSIAPLYAIADIVAGMSEEEKRKVKHETQPAQDYLAKARHKISIHDCVECTTSDNIIFKKNLERCLTSIINAENVCASALAYAQLGELLTRTYKDSTSLNQFEQEMAIAFMEFKLPTEKWRFKETIEQTIAEIPDFSHPGLADLQKGLRSMKKFMVQADMPKKAIAIKTDEAAFASEFIFTNLLPNTAQRKRIEGDLDKARQHVLAEPNDHQVKLLADLQQASDSYFKLAKQTPEKLADFRLQAKSICGKTSWAGKIWEHILLAIDSVKILKSAVPGKKINIIKAKGAVDDVKLLTDSRRKMR